MRHLSPPLPGFQDGFQNIRAAHGKEFDAVADFAVRMGPSGVELVDDVFFFVVRQLVEISSPHDLGQVFFHKLKDVDIFSFNKSRVLSASISRLGTGMK